MFRSHEEALKLEVKWDKNARSEVLELKRKLKNINLIVENTDVTFGNILRDFELKENISENSQEKILLSKLWDFILDNRKKYLRVPYTKKEIKERKQKKIEKHLNALKKLKQEVRNSSK